ncbi:MAG: serine/threonine dehydratase [Chloroflexi bacterium]|nr:serine/threonine dehydratase [Chloroflexota bacterium]
MSSSLSLSVSDVEAAAGRIRPYIRRTPLLSLAQTTRARLPWEVVLKLESLQVTGSFKPRGALNALLTLPRAEIAGGVVTASGGNHGLGVAYAARTLGVPATVYVPKTAPAVKRERIASWGAAVRLVGTEYAEAAEAAHDDAERNGKPYLHAYADPPIVAGQGTVALEFVEDAGSPWLDYLLVAIGGGGLIAGIATAVSEMPWLTVVGIEPEGAATLHAAWAAGEPADIRRLDSYASDALGARRVGELNYALARRHVARVELVTDDDIRAAQRFLWEEVQLVAEPGGAAALAGLLSGKARIPEGARIGVLVCGGNARLEQAGW